MDLQVKHKDDKKATSKPVSRIRTMESNIFSQIRDKEKIHYETTA